jgi:endoglucanase
MRSILLIAILFIVGESLCADSSWIRINQLGYKPNKPKVAIWCSKTNQRIDHFSIIDTKTNKEVWKGSAGKNFGAYGPFSTTYRLNFSALLREGKYFIKASGVSSPIFRIGNDVYAGSADYCLQYMRQQRSGYNPFLNDSCHTHDGYSLYGEEAGIKDSTHINAVGGWHDASDYLQYGTTTATAIYQLLLACNQFPSVFKDKYDFDASRASNGFPDVLDEARWGLDWLIKMHPRADWMFNQLGDDRDHMGMRIPKEDTYYGKGFERSLYFINGLPQQRGKFLNNTVGTSSTAAKYSAAFALGGLVTAKYTRATQMYLKDNIYEEKAASALDFAYRKLGVTQTASVRSPYIYAEDNWVDDMELMHANSTLPYALDKAYAFAKQEPITPWLGKDTAAHYQWYPFVNMGHYVLAQKLADKRRDTIIDFYKQGIEAVWQKAKQNAFYRGVPFIWCSNNLTVAFAQQCYWYRTLANSKVYEELEQANIDWLFGCNPWGTSMVYGLPRWGDTPVDPHSAFTHIKNYPINGGLVDGPVYTSIYKNLIGIQLKDADEYADFQSDMAVYHDDYGDYSTNEPTMDGTASLIYLLAAMEAEGTIQKKLPQFPTIPTQFPTMYTRPYKEKLGEGWTAYPSDKTGDLIKGAFVRMMNPAKALSVVFTGDEYGEGMESILNALAKEKVKAGFFLTGRFYRNPQFMPSIRKAIAAGHYMGAHSNDHLLYCDWNKRDSLLIDKKTFDEDLDLNFEAMESLGIDTRKQTVFIPPYEWWNDSVASWTNWRGMDLFSFTPGTYTNADYTWPEMGKSYQSGDTIIARLERKEKMPGGLTGNILLIHVGTDPRRKDKLYARLPNIIQWIKSKGYTIIPINKLIN